MKVYIFEEHIKEHEPNLEQDVEVTIYMDKEKAIDKMISQYEKRLEIEKDDISEIIKGKENDYLTICTFDYMNEYNFSVHEKDIIE